MTKVLINGKTIAYCDKGRWACDDKLLRDYLQVITDIEFLKGAVYVPDEEGTAVCFVKKEACETNSLLQTIEVVSAPKREFRRDVVY